MSREKKRENKQSTGGGSFFDGAAGLPVNQNVSVSSGPYAEDLPVAGTTVGEVRRKFGDRFDIADQAQAVLNGLPVKDDIVLKAGENLQFIMHAGEKGAAKIVIEDKEASFKSPEGEEVKVKLKDLLPRVGPMPSTGDVILPFGVKSVLTRDNITLWIWEKPPHVARLSWIRADSPRPYGSGTTYRHVRIALPYLIIAAVFGRDSGGMPHLLEKDECFFRNQPLKSLDDELCYPALLNCSKWPSQDGKPLSWICTQYLKREHKMRSNNPGERMQASFEAVRYCLLETSFNLSSEHHEGNSWYGASKKIDPRLATIERWEEETKKDPLFVLDIDWIKTNHTVAQFANRTFKLYAGGDGVVETANDLARLMTNL